MGLLKFFGALSPAHIGWVTLFGHRAGQDGNGNTYYRARARKGYSRERRWVVYKGEPDASTVPPLWHAWLHHQSDQMPDENNPVIRWPWQKLHQPNLTGTGNSYRPAGHVLSDKERRRSTGDYEAWTPPQ